MAKPKLTREGAKRAKQAVAFIEQLRHVKGRWAGQPFKLLPWQCDDVILPLFGTLNPDGMRQHRTAYIEIPRKNGKSSLAAAIALYMLCADNEWGAEVYGAAYDREQASIVFDIAAQIVRHTPALTKHLEVIDSQKRIVYRRTGSFYRAVSRETLGAHGFNASAIIFDEIHTQKSRDLWDVLTTSTGAREQPLVFGITTAGFGGTSLCRELHDYSEKVLRGTIKDPTQFAYIRAADPDDDWTSEKVWRKANPSLGKTINIDYLRKECRRAKELPSYQNTFRRYHLNQWTQQEERWIDLRVWDACAPAAPAPLEGRACYGGLDLASNIDIAAFVLDFPPQNGGAHDLLAWFWIPEEGMRERIQRDRVPYDAWVRDGLVQVTPGNVIDHRAIRLKIEALKEVFDIREIAFDRWGAVQISTELQDAGFTMVQFGQGFASMSPASKEFQRLLLAKNLRHGGNTVLRWMADNVVIEQDPAGNIKPSRKHSTEKIDGIVAAIMALDRAIRNEGSGPSVYEERGIEFV